jgi:hypothetical protein
MGIRHMLERKGIMSKSGVEYLAQHPGWKTVKKASRANAKDSKLAQGKLDAQRAARERAGRIRDARLGQ